MKLGLEAAKFNLQLAVELKKPAERERARSLLRAAGAAEEWERLMVGLGAEGTEGAKFCRGELAAAECVFDGRN